MQNMEDQARKELELAKLRGWVTWEEQEKRHHLAEQHARRMQETKINEQKRLGAVETTRMKE